MSHSEPNIDDIHSDLQNWKPLKCVIDRDKINRENRGFNIQIRGPFDRNYGIHVDTAGNTMRLSSSGVQITEDNLGTMLLIDAKLHCAIDAVIVAGIPFAMYRIVSGQNDVKSLDFI